MFVSLVDAFKRKVIQPSIDKKMNQAGMAWVEEAKRLVSVDTGKTRDLIGFSYSAEDMQLNLYCDSPIALFLEFGTSRMAPRAFMRPAMNVIGAVWKGSVNIQAVNTPEKYVERIKDFKYRLKKGANLQVGHKKHHK